MTMERWPLKEEPCSYSAHEPHNKLPHCRASLQGVHKQDPSRHSSCARPRSRKQLQLRDFQIRSSTFTGHKKWSKVMKTLKAIEQISGHSNVELRSGRLDLHWASASLLSFAPECVDITSTRCSITHGAMDTAPREELLKSPLRT